MTLLSVEGIRVVLGGVVAVDAVDLDVADASIVGLIGPNGAGKTTLVNAVSGYAKPESGSVTLDGVDITGWRPERLLRQGLARTFQGARLFEGMTVLENVEVAAMSKHGRRAARRRALAVLEQLDLDSRQSLLAGILGAGEQRLLGLARSLAAEPRMLMLDEPAAGLNDEESVALAETLRRLPKEYNLALVVIEHDMGLIMNLCDEITVLESGKRLSHGTPAEVRNDPRVIEAYLGKSAA